MLAKSYLDFRARLDQEGAVLTYCGFVSERVLMALGETLKHRMADTDSSVTRRLFSIFIEQVQNVIRYSEERLSSGGDAPAVGGGLIIVGAREGQYFVVCGNLVERSRAERLKARLDHLAGLDKESVRQYYREKLREPPEDESVGATIGLVEIVRRSSRPIEYDFYPTDNDTSFFCLKAFV